MMERCNILAAMALTVACLVSTAARADDEVSLFDSQGRATAYVAQDLTIYLWAGKPVAYLHADSSGGFHVYGFNGKHLGWLVSGVLRDHDGRAVGAVEAAFSGYTEYEPYKGYKQYAPYKSYRQYAPYRPYLTSTWSRTPLQLFLLRGRDA